MLTLSLLLGFGCLIGIVVLARRVSHLETRLSHETATRVVLERRLASQPAPPAGEPAARREPRDSPLSQPVATPTSALRAAPIPVPAAVPPPLPPTRSTPPAPQPTLLPPVSAPVPAEAAFDWERFMGARLFAWLGGLALFLGVAYFVKYSFERGLIPPDVRVLLGLILGGGLVAAGLRLRNPVLAVTAQTLAATGVVILYGSLYSGHALYHLWWLPDAVTLAAMSVVTAGSILLARQLKAQVIALLGLVGGFLTPLLFSTGRDPGWPFFLYVALLDVGLLVIVLRQGWNYQATLASIGTLLLEGAWLARHFTADRTGMVVGLFALFLTLFSAACLQAARRGAASDGLCGGVAIQILGALSVVFWLQQGSVGQDQPWAVFGLLALAEGAAIALVLSSPTWSRGFLVTGLLVFAALTAWQLNHAHHVALGWVLGGSLGFAAVNTVGPLLFRGRAGAPQMMRAAQFFPALGVISVAVSLLRLGDTPFALWPTLLVLDVSAILLAARIGGALGALFTLIASAVLLGLGIGLGASRPEPMDTPWLGMIALVSVAFVIGGSWLRRRQSTTPDHAAASGLAGIEDAAAAQIPIIASIMPFLLLAQAAGLVSLPQPGLLLLVAAGMTLLMLGVAAWLKEEWLTLGALLGNALVGHVWWWHSGHLATAPSLVVLWNAATALTIAGFPFVVAHRMPALRWPWIAAALAAIPSFHLTYRMTLAFWPNPVMGLVPLAYALVPAGAFLLVWHKCNPPPTIAVRASDPVLSRLAWLGGAALFLITVALPVQFERQWLTIGLALEGAALVALYGRVPHAGLRLTGIGLLTVAAIRLLAGPIVGPAVNRGPWGILNTWLSTYGVTIAATFLALRWLSVPGNRPGLPAARPWLGSLGIALCFVLLNLEIAACFTPVGEVVRLEFTGHFARDMTYTVAWSLFALTLLILGIRGAWTAVRWAGLALLAVSTLKLFLQDLARLDQLYRVGALVGVAVIAITASILYQKFIGRERDPATGRTPP